MAKDFISEVQTFRGTSGDALPVATDLTTTNTGIAAGGAITQWGVRGQLALIQHTVEGNKAEVNNVVNTLYGDDATNGGVGTVLRDIKDMNTNVTSKSDDMNLKFTDLTSTDHGGNSGKYGDMVSKYNDIAVTAVNGHAGKYGDMVSKYNDIVVDDANGNTGKYGDMLAKHAEVAVTTVNGNVGLHGDVVAKYNAIAVTDTNGNSGLYGDVVSKHSDTTAKYNELIVTEVNGHAGKYGDVVAKHGDVVAKEALVSPHYSNIDNIGNDIAGKDMAGNAYTGVTGSRVTRVGENIGKGVNSELLTVGADLIQAGGKLETVTEAVYKGKIETVADATYKDAIGVVAAGGYKEDVQIVADLEYRQKVAAVADNMTAIEAVGNEPYKSKVENVNANMADVNNAAANAALAKDWATKTTEVESGKWSSMKYSLDSEAHKNKAQEWAESVNEVEPGKKSAKTWAEEAGAIVSNGLVDDDESATIKVYSSDKTERLVGLLLSTMMSNSDAQATLDVDDNGAISAGDNTITCNIVEDSSDTNVLVIDDANDKVIMKKTANYSVLTRFRFGSTIDEARDVVVKLVDDADVVVASVNGQINVKDGEHKVYEYAMHVSNTVADKALRVVVNISDDGYKVTDGKVYVVSNNPAMSDEIATLTASVNSNTNAVALLNDGNGVVGSVANKVKTTSKDADFSSTWLSSTTINTAIDEIKGKMETADTAVTTAYKQADTVVDGKVNVLHGTSSSIMRYDTRLSALNTVEFKYNAEDDPVTVRYVGDGNTAAPYFRDEIEYDGNGNPIKIKHYYNTADLASASGTTTINYSGDNPVSQTYSE